MSLDDVRKLTNTTRTRRESSHAPALAVDSISSHPEGLLSILTPFAPA